MRRTLLLVVLWLGALPGLVPGAYAESIEININSATHASVDIKSLRALKFQSVVRQQQDFSCGSAAVATLLTYHYQHPISEQEILDDMYRRGNPDVIRAQGFSLLDMKQYLDARGYSADGIYASLDDLARVGVPAILLIEDKGYKHFVVVKGIKDSQVLVGDPAAGLKRYRREELEKLWTNGILFVVRSRGDIAKRHFNVAQEWNALPPPPLTSAVSQDSLATITILRRPTGDF